MVINRQFGQYVLLRRLAVGGQSEVFLAEKAGPHTYTRPVVIKALPSDRREDEKHVELFYREAFISSRFNHPNVINIHDAMLIEGEHCMLMDFVSGQTVADIAQRGYKNGTPPTLKQVVQIIADGLAGLHYVHNFRDLDGHQYSVVHRDVSPQNLMVTYHGTTMMFDFGIARIIGLDAHEETLGGGKYAYMSPEQILGEAVGPASDIFSMGVILYELSTGFRLFRRNSPPEVIRAVTEEPIKLPRELRPEIPQFLETCIMRALERDPLSRYSSAGDMRNDLKQFLEMTSDGGDIRRGLGAYVSALFRKERADISKTLLEAPKILNESKPVAGNELQELGAEAFPTERDATMELADPEAIEMLRQAALHGADEPHLHATREMREALTRMQRQQRILYGVIIFIALVALVLIGAQISSADTGEVSAHPTKAAQP